MTKAQIVLIKKTWKLLREIDPQVIGDVFYSKLFTDEPRLRRLFKISLQEQSAKLVDMLSLIVSNLENPEQVKTDIVLLGRRHIGYGVKQFDYELIGTALLWTLEQGLGTDWNRETEQAWQLCYASVAGMMCNLPGNFPEQ